MTTRRIHVTPSTYRGLEIPGGWQASVPSIMIARTDERFAKLVAFFTRNGAAGPRAETLALGVCQALFEGSWETKMKMYLGRCATKYAKLSGGTLDGFEPEVLADLFVPGSDRFWGGRGNHEQAQALAAMIARRRGA